MDDWFAWITLWRLILTVPEIKQLERDRKLDKMSPRKVLLDSDVMFICLLLVSTKADAVSIGKVARAIDTENLKDTKKRERQRITPKIFALADYGLLNLVPEGSKNPKYSISASKLLITVLRKLHEQRNGN